VNVDHRAGPGVDAVAELDDLPFPDNTFQVALASHVLEHVPDLFKTLREIRRVLVPRGLLIAWVPYGFEAFTVPYHVRVFVERTVPYLIDNMESADLDQEFTGFRRVVSQKTKREGSWHLQHWLNVGRRLGPKREIRFVLEAHP
jgi:ubiquinone/menaquinone biosynthesis C-methylase UbiE